MAFRANNLSALTYANGFTLWHYKTSDLKTEVDTIGYFNGAAAMLRVGDFLLVNLSTGSTPEHGAMVVTTAANGTVDVTNLTPFGSLNSD